MSEISKGGRPPIQYDQRIADAICELMADGATLKTICSVDGMPSNTTVRQWLRKEPEFARAYARAQQYRADTYAEQIIDIADDRSQDIYEDNDGIIKNDNQAVARDKLRIDARKWYASKISPKKYGDKLELAGDDEAPLKINIIRYSED